jgi:hypothetical protein
MSYDQMMRRLWRERTWERNPRRGSCQPTVLCHRFPIKGGLTFGEALMLNNRNKLLDLVSGTPQ